MLDLPRCRTLPPVRLCRLLSLTFFYSEAILPLYHVWKHLPRNTNVAGYWQYATIGPIEAGPSHGHGGLGLFQPDPKRTALAINTILSCAPSSP